MKTINGVKIALIHNDSLITILRDDIPTINFPNVWDFPGGEREGDETPFECMNRELEEELSISLSKDAIIFEKEFPSMHLPDTHNALFMVANVSSAQLAEIRFGDEGQEWKLYPIDDFLKASDVVPKLKSRLRSYLDSR